MPSKGDKRPVPAIPRDVLPLRVSCRDADTSGRRARPAFAGLSERQPHGLSVTVDKRSGIRVIQTNVVLWLKLMSPELAYHRAHDVSPPPIQMRRDVEFSLFMFELKCTENGVESGFRRKLMVGRAAPTPHFGGSMGSSITAGQSSNLFLIAVKQGNRLRALEIAFNHRSRTLPAPFRPQIRGCGKTRLSGDFLRSITCGYSD
ncbi:hypothetical protein EVAR_65235_1 [Eumeta japonica]|uniref:Uncharacterized protein n=1 Tax=Eumeta variegata TaxID=151549 RepID=A0A4C1ZJT1_EUMVA|nr:hypothetical protein EVAR_65235_1 [Eumeta japonica]